MRPCAKRPLIVAAVLGLFAFSAEAQVTERLGASPFVTPGGEGGAEALAVTNFSIVAAITLEALTVQELLGISNSAVDVGAWFAGADPEAGVTLNTAVVRVVEPIWDARFTNQTGNLSNIDVQMSLSGLDGSSGFLTNVLNPASRIRATVVPTGPQRIGSQGKQTLLLQGGAQFLLDCTQAILTGDYGGQLLVTVNQF